MKYRYKVVFDTFEESIRAFQNIRPVDGLDIEWLGDMGDGYIIGCHTSAAATRCMLLGGRQIK